MKKTQVVLALLFNSVASINLKNLKNSDGYGKSEKSLLVEVGSESRACIVQEDEGEAENNNEHEYDENREKRNAKRYEEDCEGDE